MSPYGMEALLLSLLGRSDEGTLIQRPIVHSQILIAADLATLQGLGTQASTYLGLHYSSPIKRIYTFRRSQFSCP